MSDKYFHYPRRHKLLSAIEIFSLINFFKKYKWLFFEKYFLNNSFLVEQTEPNWIILFLGQQKLEKEKIESASQSIEGTLSPENV